VRLIARLRIASSSWLASTRAAGQALRNIQPQRDARPQRPLQQIAHALDQVRRSTGTARRSCCRRERQQPLRQRRAALGALHRAVDQPVQTRIVGNALAQQIEVAHHHHQQIVEIMRDAAGELADRLHLLCLAQLLLRLFARRDLLHQIGGALFDALFERRRQFRQRRALGRQLRPADFRARFRQPCAP